MKSKLPSSLGFGFVILLRATGFCLGREPSPTAAGRAAGDARPVLQPLVAGRPADRRDDNPLDRQTASFAEPGTGGWPDLSPVGARTGRDAGASADRRAGAADSDCLPFCRRDGRPHAHLPDTRPAFRSGRAGPARDVSHVGNPVGRRRGPCRADLLRLRRRVGDQYAGPEGRLEPADRCRLERAQAGLEGPARAGQEGR